MVLRNENGLFHAFYFTLQYSTQSREPDTFAENEICFLPDKSNPIQSGLFSPSQLLPGLAPKKKCWLSLFPPLFFVPPAENREVEYYFSVLSQIACGMILSSKNRLGRSRAQCWDCVTLLSLCLLVHAGGNACLSQSVSTVRIVYHLFEWKLRENLGE